MHAHRYFLKFSLFMLTIVLGACSSSPSHLIVAPELLTTPNIHYSNKTAQLEVVDMRSARHIVQILREDEAATLLSAEHRIVGIIESTLKKQWKKQGLLINEHGKNKINISIEKAIISVTQATMSYQVQTEIIIKVRINNSLQTQMSTFKNRGNSKGPLHADIAVLERNFNQRLTNLLTQILANKKIASFLK